MNHQLEKSDRQLLYESFAEIEHLKKLILQINDKITTIDKERQRFWRNTDLSVDFVDANELVNK